MDRRTFLRVSIPAALVGLAGCSGGDPTPTPGAEDTPTATPTDSPTAAPTDSPTATESRTPTDTQAPTDSPTATDTQSPTATATPTPASVDEITVVVGPDGRNRFDPEQFRLTVGGTVTWEWDSSFHSVTPQDQPSGSNWSGTGTETHDAGYTHTHTFETAGEYTYYCRPHRDFGMTGSFSVE